MRRPLSESILLIGGTASLPGIKSRLLSELRHFISTPKYSNKLFVENFKMHKSPSHENYTAWLGGLFFFLFIIFLFIGFRFFKSSYVIYFPMLF